MNKFLSQKLRVLSFMAIVLIVYLHTNFSMVTGSFIAIVSGYITQQLTRVSVPLFYIISGFLFFRNCEQFNLDFYSRKMVSRIRTLLIPFLLWSLWGLLFVWCMQLLKPDSFSSVGDVSAFSVSRLLFSWLWQPIGAYQLWFIRDLFICFALSPLLFFALKIFRELFVYVLFLVYLLGWQYAISIESVFYVYTGAYIALYQPNLMIKKISSAAAVLLLGVSWIVICFYAYSSDSYFIQCIGILIGLLFIWFGYDVFYPKMKMFTRYSSLLNYTFFIYVFHEPLHTIVKGLMISLISGQIGMFVVYFLSPIITIIICISVGSFFKHYSPTVYTFACGGR